MAFEAHQQRIWDWFWKDEYRKWYAFGASLQPGHISYAYQNWRILNHLFFDTETNGFVMENEWERVANDQFRILSYSGDLFFNRRLRDQKDLLCDPLIPLDPQAQAAHGITDSMVAGQPKFEEIWGDIQNQFENAHVVFAYNAQFDISALIHECIRNDIPYQEFQRSINKPVIDFLIWEREFQKALGGRKKKSTLSETASRYGIPYMAKVAHNQGRMHVARADVEVLHQLARELAPDLPYCVKDTVNRQSKYFIKQQAYLQKKYGPKPE